MKNPVYLVDGSGYIFRAFYGVQGLSTSDGFPTNALFGFSKMLLKLLHDAESAHIVVVFDAGRETFRTELFKDYKANRIELPKELEKQMPFFRTICAALGILVLEQKGYEADDIIATLSERLHRDGHDVVIVSGDKDLLQLVNHHIQVWDTMKDKWYRREEVKEKMGVYPEQVVDLLGLMGDSSDNVPGLSGVGPKTALQLIEKYGGIEQILQSAPTIRNDSAIRGRAKLADQIEQSADYLRLSKKLVEVHREVPVVFRCDGKEVMLGDVSSSELESLLARGAPDTGQLAEITKRFEFNNLFGDAASSRARNPFGADKGTYATIFARDFSSWVKTLHAQREFAFDVETTSLDPREARLIGASFSWNDREAFYVPIGHSGVESAEDQVGVLEFIAAVKGPLEDRGIGKIGQNLKYDIQVMEQLGVQLRGVSFDTMIAHYLLDPDVSSHNLTVLASEFLDESTIEFDEIVPKGSTFASVSLDTASRYACQDADYVWRLRAVLEPKLEERGLTRVFRELEIPLVEILAAVESAGVKLDTAKLYRMSQEFGVQLETLQGEIFSLAGAEFNMNSPKQLSEILFDKLALPTKGLKKTKTGISTDSGVLEKLSPLHPLPAKILEYRALFKLKSTYIDTLPMQVSSATGRLHTKLSQVVTGTGRLSSSEPNLQNIPVSTAEGRRIRGAFIAESGNVLISADYSQIELRVLAHLSGDENLIAAFTHDIDIHSKTAREILGIPDDAPISPEDRRMGKTINFGVVYGMGPYRLARDLGIPFGEAERYITSYFARYPKVRQFFDEVERSSKECGYVSTLYGRKRFLSSIEVGDRDQGFVMRAALNAPIQGSAADIIKAAMIKVPRALQASELDCRMILQIHDELLFECKAEDAEASRKVIVHEMESVVQFKVPLKVDARFGATWEEVH